MFMWEKILIDDDDYAKFGKYKVSIDKRLRVKIYLKKHYDGQNRYVFLHRIIMGVSDKKIQVDHINGNRLDNRKENLRLCSNHQNHLNKSKTSRNKSGYKGVSFFKSSGKRLKPWCAEATFHGKKKHLGYYSTAEQASNAYESFCKEHHGVFYYKLGHANDARN